MGSVVRTLQSLRPLTRLPQLGVTPGRAMTYKTSHEERTAADHREPDMHTVILNKIEHLSRYIRLLQLRPYGEMPKASNLTH